MPQPPASAAEITTADEARLYYAKHLARMHGLDCHGKIVRVYFEPTATHLYSEKPAAGASIKVPVSRRLNRHSVEVREFSLDRARLMDEVLRAIVSFTVSIPGTAARGGENRVLFGPRLPDGRYLCVVLNPGPGDAFTCLSAYPVSHQQWMQAVRAKRAKFP